jgi:hypothetical protein
VDVDEFFLEKWRMQLFDGAPTQVPRSGKMSNQKIK